MGMSLKSEQGKVLITVLLGTFTVILNNSSLNPAIPEFMKIFSINAVSASWIITIFLIAMGITMPLTGYLGDRFGKKRIYLLGLSLFVAGSLLGAVSWGLIPVIVSRGMQGIAGGLMIPLSLAMIFEASPREERGKVTGIWGIAVMVAPAIGPTVGGIAIGLSSWHSLFLINMPTGLLGLLLGFRYLKHAPPNPSRTFDQAGFASVTLGVGAILLALGRISDLADLTAPFHVTLMAAGVCLLILFVRIELRQQQPLLNVRIFKVPMYSLSVIVASVQAFAMFAGIFMIPLLVQNVYGYDAIMTGFVFLPSALFTGLFVTVGGRRLDLKGPRGIALAGLAITCATTAMLGLLKLNSPLWIIFLLMMLRGAGLGLSNMPITTAGLNAIPDYLVSQGSAINNMARRMVSSLGIVMVSIYFEVRKVQLLAQGYSPAEGSLQAINEGFIALSILVLLTLPAAFFMRKPAVAEEEQSTPFP
jgi:EmrB/QacA subfamily drug resistance transporter